MAGRCIEHVIENVIKDFSHFVQASMCRSDSLVRNFSKTTESPRGHCSADTVIAIKSEYNAGVIRLPCVIPASSLE